MAAAALVVLSFQCKKNRQLFFMQMLGTALFTLHFGLLGQMPGVLLNAVCVLRALVVYLREERGWARSPVWLAALLAAYTAVSVLTWEGIVSLWLLAVLLLMTVAMWMNHPRSIRWVQLLGVSPAWLVYNCMAFSIGGMANEIFNILSVLLFFFRTGLGKKKSPVEADKRSFG